MVTKKSPAKKSTKKPTVKKSVTGSALERKVKDLEMRVSVLEQNDITAKASDAYKSMSTRIQESYEANPTRTMVIAGLVVVIILLIIK